MAKTQWYVRAREFKNQKWTYTSYSSKAAALKAAAGTRAWGFLAQAVNKKK